MKRTAALTASFLSGILFVGVALPALAVDPTPDTGSTDPSQVYSDPMSQEECKTNPLLCRFGQIGEGTQLGGLDRVEFLSWSGRTVYEGGPPAYAARIINTLLGMLGLLAIVTVFYAGFLWMTAQGNEEKISKAQEILLGTIIGILLTLMSYSILSWAFTAIARAV